MTKTNTVDTDAELSVLRADISHLNAIAQIHLEAFRGFFLESLGAPFLEQMYHAFITDPRGICLVVVEGNRVVGFAAGTTQPDGFFRRLLWRRWPMFVVTGASALIQHPLRVGRKFLSALRYRGEQPADVPKATLLSSIGVSPNAVGRSIGTTLLSAFCAIAREAGSPSVYLTTDRDNNDLVNRFYMRNGFTLHSSFLKDHDRPMNMYLKVFRGALPMDRTACIDSSPPTRVGDCLKRVFDLVVSAVAIIVLSPLMLVIAVLVRIDSAGPPLFRQTRVGKSFRPFQLLKFRSMVSGNSGAEITCGNEARITRFGAILRRLKLDELPQLWNVLRGDMSFVGPRPEVPAFVEQFRVDYEQLLQVRPGITDPASIRYRSESELLSNAPDPISYYRNVILPDKISISRAYVQSASVRKDLSIIVQTFVALFRG